MKIKDFKLNGLHTREYINEKFDKVVIALHGFSGDCDSSVIKAIAEDLLNHNCMLITYDLPKHGENNNEGTLTLDECLESIKKIDEYVKQTYENKKICWFATSFGGYLLLNFLNNNEYEYDKVILRAPAIFMDKVIDSVIMPFNGYSLEDLNKGEINLDRDHPLFIDNKFYEDLKKHKLIDNYINKNYLHIIQGKKDNIVNYLDNEKFFNSRCFNEHEFYYFENADHSFKKTGELDRIVEITRNIICDYDVIKAHEYSLNNKKQIILSDKCGCFHCNKIFESKEVKEYIKDKEETALCPYCKVDAVIGDESHYPINEHFLKKMNKKWF